ncbi:hypothetical protein R3P38DRAFT_2961063 [Favolaschia claudopus]|uniref:Secreted protein n=1 Tax=Favolaschia claudopus TaxID=2862362 RepID=A0AAW0B8Z2_9AGAR
MSQYPSTPSYIFPLYLLVTPLLHCERGCLALPSDLPPTPFSATSSSRARSLTAFCYVIYAYHLATAAYWKAVDCLKPQAPAFVLVLQSDRLVHPSPDFGVGFFALVALHSINSSPELCTLGPLLVTRRTNHVATNVQVYVSRAPPDPALTSTKQPQATRNLMCRTLGPPILVSYFNYCGPRPRVSDCLPPLFQANRVKPCILKAVHFLHAGVRLPVRAPPGSGHP